MSGYGLKKNQALSIILENDLKEAGYNIKVINGSVSGENMFPIIIKPEEKIDIDHIDDFKIAEEKLKNL